MITRWNEFEDEALQGLPYLAQLLYLRCLRRYMDFDTGIVGVKRRVSYQMFREVLYIDEVPGRRLKDREITTQVLRSAVDQLVRNGLVERRSEERQLIFFLPLALLQETPLKIQSNRAATEQQQTRSNRAGANTGGGFGSQGNKAATDPYPQSSNIPPVSGSGKKESNTPSGVLPKKEGPPPGILLTDDQALNELVRQGVSWEAAQEFVDYRSHKNAVITFWVIEELVRESTSAGIAADKAIREMINSNWPCFMSQWYQNKHRQVKQHEGSSRFDQSAPGKVLNGIVRRDARGNQVCDQYPEDAREAIDGEYRSETH